MAFCEAALYEKPVKRQGRLAAYRVQDGKVAYDEAASVRLSPGSGPRSGEWSADGRHLYLTNELASSVTHLVYFCRVDSRMLFSFETAKQPHT